MKKKNLGNTNNSVLNKNYVIPVLLFLAACSNQSYLPPAPAAQPSPVTTPQTTPTSPVTPTPPTPSAQDGVLAHKVVDEIKTQAFQESLNSIKEVPKMVKDKSLTEDQGRIVLKVAAQEYFEKPFITDEGLKAVSLAEAIFAINEGKIVENLTDLLGLEISYESDPNQYKRFRKLFQVLERTQSLKKLMSPKKDRFLIEILMLVQSREGQKKSFVEMFPEAQSYFEKQLLELQSNYYQQLEGYALLNQITQNKKWLAKVLLPAFNSLELSSINRQSNIDAFGSVAISISQNQIHVPLNPQFFKNTQYLLSRQLELFKQNETERDRTFLFQDLVQIMDTLNLLFDTDSRNVAISKIELWDDFLVENSKTNRTIKEVLAKPSNSEFIKTQRISAKHFLTQAVLLKILDDKNINQLKTDSNNKSFFEAYKSIVLNHAKKISESGSVKSGLAAYREYFSTFEAVKTYLELKSSLAEGDVIKKGSIVNHQIVKSEEQEAKLYAENILTKALDVLYKDNLEGANIKNCILSQDKENLKIAIENCKILTDTQLRYTAVSKIKITEDIDVVKNIKLQGEGKLYIPAGRFYISPKSTLELEYPEIEFHPLAKIEILSGVIKIKTQQLIGAYLDVSAADQTQDRTNADLGKRPDIVRHKTHLGTTLSYYFIADRGHKVTDRSMGSVTREYWFRVNSVELKTINLESEFQNIDAMLGSSVGPSVGTNALEVSEINDIEKNIFLGVPPSNLVKQPDAETGGVVDVKFSKSDLDGGKSSNLLIFAEGGNGASGLDGIPSPLCQNNEYKPYEFILANEENYQVFSNGEATPIGNAHRFSSQVDKLNEITLKNNIKFQIKVKGTSPLIRSESTTHAENLSAVHVYTYGIYQIDLPGSSASAGGSGGNGGSVVTDRSANSQVELSAYISSGVAGEGGRAIPVICLSPGEVSLPGVDGKAGQDGKVVGL